MNYGKQSHSSTLHRKRGLVVASSNKSSDDGINSAATAIADSAALTLSSSSTAGGSISGAPPSSEPAGSEVAPVINLHSSPPSFVKPPGPSDAKDLENPTTKKALFQNPPPKDSDHVIATP